MIVDVTVCIASPLIVFHQIGRLELVGEVLGNLLIPPAVANEIAPSMGTLPSWVQITSSPFALDPMPWWSSLDPGEIEAIALALDRSARLVVLDDRSARRAARQLGLKVVGSVGILLQAHQRGLIGAVQPDLDAMLAVGFHLSRALYEEILAIAAEQR
jgi:predicted nucleic acid-binding protein